MNQKLLIAVTVLSLSACAGRTVKDDSPASDLDVLVANVKAQATPELLPNGKTYCGELATTEDDQDDCIGDLEDAVFMLHRKLDRIVGTVVKYADRERLKRNPCSWWERAKRAPRCKPP